MITILGGGGVISNAISAELVKENEPVRVVSRSHATGAAALGQQMVTADVSDLGQTAAAVSGSRLVFLLVGLKYDITVWRTTWPTIMRNTIEACKRAGARLVFFDNVYMYGAVDGAMTEDTPFNPSSEKGAVRAQIATMLLEEIKAGNLSALIARSADFYGPGAATGIPNVLVFDNLARGRTAYWLVNDSVPHSFTYTPDAARSLIALAKSERAWNETWHLPTAAPPPTAREFIDLVAKDLGVRSRRLMLTRPIVKVGGWFDSNIRELYEMLYQYDRPYVFDSTKIARALDLHPTSYADGIRATANSYRSRGQPPTGTTPGRRV
jgi:nucleoside-diphosphate-sugar epimerase